jgi:hypothetical protein
VSAANRVVPETGRTRPKYLSLAETLLNQGYGQAVRQASSPEFSRTEYGLVHPSGSKLRLTDTGDIALKTPNGTGILLDEEHSSILLHAKFAHIDSQYLQLRLRPTGFRLNGYYLNPELLAAATVPLTENGVTRPVALFLPAPDDTELDDLLKELDLL